VREAWEPSRWAGRGGPVAGAKQGGFEAGEVDRIVGYRPSAAGRERAPHGDAEA
jgi:hypothetical protein